MRVPFVAQRSTQHFHNNKPPRFCRGGLKLMLAFVAGPPLDDTRGFFVIPAILPDHSFAYVALRLLSVGSSLVVSSIWSIHSGGQHLHSLERNFRLMSSPFMLCLSHHWHHRNSIYGRNALFASSNPIFLRFPPNLSIIPCKNLTSSHRH
jgi:hypothetical protein